MTESAKTYVVDPFYFWQDIATCPLGRKVQLLNLGGVAVHGTISEKTRQDFLGWTPLPKMPEWMRRMPG